MNYPSQTDVVSEATTYNGWTNYETWNVSLYINNEYDLYKMACAFVKGRKMYANGSITYDNFIPFIKNTFGDKTPDGVAWDASNLDHEELDEMLNELVD